VSWPASIGRPDFILTENYATNASLMTPVQLVEAQKLAREWKPK
jgi:hypothetical protein